MPISITKAGLRVIQKDSQSTKYKTTFTTSVIPYLKFDVDIEPGVTVRDIFNMIQSDKQLVEFLSKWLWCDVEEVLTNDDPGSMPISHPRTVTRVDIPEDYDGEVDHISDDPQKVMIYDTVATCFWIYPNINIYKGSYESHLVAAFSDGNDTGWVWNRSERIENSFQNFLNLPVYLKRLPFHSEQKRLRKKRLRDISLFSVLLRILEPFGGETFHITSSPVESEFLEDIMHKALDNEGFRSEDLEHWLMSDDEYDKSFENDEEE